MVDEVQYEEEQLLEKPIDKKKNRNFS